MKNLMLTPKRKNECTMKEKRRLRMEKKHIAEEVAARIVATRKGKSETVEKEGRRVKE